MEANKYYTPKVEEFHVGFEYEYFIMEGWQPVAYHPSDMAEAERFLETLYSNKIRVKYLDREDIESLGFKFGTQLTERTAMYHLEACNHTSLSYNEKEHTIRVAVHNGVVEVLKNIIIKNKSELRKILIQAEILEDEK